MIISIIITQIAYSNLKNLYIADLKTYKILSSIDVKSDKINVIKFNNLNLIIGNALYIASFDRNIYKVELDTLKIDKIMQTSNLPTAMMDLNQELIIGLIDGNIIYKDKIIKSQTTK